MTPNFSTFGFLIKIQITSNLLKIGIHSNCKFFPLICGKDIAYIWKIYSIFQMLEFIQKSESLRTTYSFCLSYHISSITCVGLRKLRWINPIYSNLLGININLKILNGGKKDINWRRKQGYLVHNSDYIIILKMLKSMNNPMF